MKKKFSVIVLALMIFLNSGMIYAQDSMNTLEVGVIDLANGKGQVLIKSTGNESLLHKKFTFIHLFTVEESEDGESFEYSVANQDVKKALKTSVLKAQKEIDGGEASEICEEQDISMDMVVDYIRSLEENQGKDKNLRTYSEILANEVDLTKESGVSIEIMSTRADGSYLIKGLKEGYYIIIDDTKDSKMLGKYSASGLVCMMHIDDNACMEIKSDLPVIQKKIREDNDRQKIGNDGWNDIGDFETGQVIPFKFESRVFDMTGMPKCDYVFHDCMDEGLQFLENVEIIINNANKHYQLGEEEFEVITNNLPEGETFIVKIPDIKRLCEKEFMEDKNFGQNITLTFDGMLTEDAAKKCGRPGFENNVYLEFMNEFRSDKEETKGKTPVDTTVCYTFGVELTKKNDSNELLENAVFRLYRDENQKKKVFFNKLEDGTYVVAGEGGEKDEVVSDKDGKIKISGLDYSCAANQCGAL